MERLRNEPAIIIVTFVAVAEFLFTQTGMPEWLHVASGVVVAIGGALGLRSRVTPNRKL